MNNHRSRVIPAVLVLFILSSSLSAESGAADSDNPGLGEAEIGALLLGGIFLGSIAAGLYFGSSRSRKIDSNPDLSKPDISWQLGMLGLGVSGVGLGFLSGHDDFPVFLGFSIAALGAGSIGFALGGELGYLIEPLFRKKE